MPTAIVNGRVYQEVLVRGNPNEPLPVDIQGATLSLDAAGVEIANDQDNPVPVLQGFALPPYNEFVLDDPDKPTEIVYSVGGVEVATVTLTYADEGAGGLISGSIAYPGG